MSSPKNPQNNLAESIKTATLLRDLRSIAERHRTSLASWLFLVGSLIFLLDGFLELSESISIHALLHLTASVLFTIGSALFIPHKN